MDPLTAAMMFGPQAIAAIQTLRFIKDELPNSDVIPALFDSDGELLGGSDRVVAELHNQEPEGVWFYEVEPIDGYAFQRFPVTDSGIQEQIGRQADAVNPDTRYWRWIAEAQHGVLYGAGEPPNALVNFVVVGYRTQAILDYFE